MQNEKSKFGTLILTVIMAATLFSGNSLNFMHARAQDTATSGTTQTSAQTNVICQAEMQVYADAQLKDFRSFITTNFQNKSSTSSLLEIAINRYKQLRTSLYNKYATYFPQEGALLLTEGIEPGACMEIVDNTLALARRELSTRAMQTATVKKTTAILDKYQQINDKLGALNLTFLKMKGYLDTFSAKLPCYLAKSCNKG
jgi:hypothetical protein